MRSILGPSLAKRSGGEEPQILDGTLRIKMGVATLERRLRTHK
jgi:hypothetical protein